MKRISIIRGIVLGLAFSTIQLTAGWDCGLAFGEAEIGPHLRAAAELRMLNPHLSAPEREQAFALARGELD